MTPFRFVILTPTERYFDGDVLSLVFPTAEGQIGVLRGRAKCVIAVSSGVLRYTLADGNVITAVTEGGFADVDGTVTFTTEEICMESEAESFKLRREQERAEERDRQEKSIAEYRMSEAALAKAFDKLKRARHNNK